MESYANIVYKHKENWLLANVIHYGHLMFSKTSNSGVGYM